MLESTSCWERSDRAISTVLPLMFLIPYFTWDFSCFYGEYSPLSKQKKIAAMDLTWGFLCLMLIKYLQSYCAPEFPQCFSLGQLCSEIWLCIILLLALKFLHFSRKAFLSGCPSPFKFLPVLFLFIGFLFKWNL